MKSRLGKKPSYTSKKRASSGIRRSVPSPSASPAWVRLILGPCICVLYTSLLSLNLTTPALYIYAGQPKAAVVVLRWVWLRYQFQTQPLRLLHTLLSRGLGAVDACNQSNLQKFFIRQLKQVDGVVEGKGAVGDEKDEDAGDGDEEDEENTGENVFKPTVSNPVYLLAYGHLLLVARSFQSSISTPALFWPRFRFRGPHSSLTLQYTCFALTSWLRTSL